MSNKEIALLLKSQEKSIQAVLPPQIPTSKFFRTVLMACDNNPALYSADQQSLLQSCRKAAADGLLIDGREAVLIPFGKSITYIPMYLGILKKVRQSGELKSITIEVVRENDEFSYWVDELGQHLKHVPARKNRGEMELVYAVAVLKDGGTQIEVMDEEKIHKVRGASKSAGSSSSPWKLWTEAMWKKSVLRQVCKYLPSSTDLDNVYQNDNEDYDFKKGAEVDITPTQQRSTLDSIADKFKTQTHSDFEKDVPMFDKETGEVKE